MEEVESSLSLDPRRKSECNEEENGEYYDSYEDLEVCKIYQHHRLNK